MQTPRWNPAFTPPQGKQAALLVALWWLSRLFSNYEVCLTNTLPRTYSAETPFYTWVVEGYTFVPLLIGASVFVLRRYPGTVSLWYWNRQSSWLSGFWTAITLLVLANLLAQCSLQGVVALASSIFGIYIVLVARAVLVARC